MAIDAVRLIGMVKTYNGTPRIKPNAELAKIMRGEMDGPPFVLNKQQRIAVHHEIEDVCRRRSYFLHALNVRTNHLHSVVTAETVPENIINAFKSNATRALREQNLISRDIKVWSVGKSRRYLWKPRSVALAIDYTLNQQGENLIEFEDWLKMKGESLEDDEYLRVCMFVTPSLPVGFPPCASIYRGCLNRSKKSVNMIVAASLSRTRFIKEPLTPAFHKRPRAS